MKMEGEIYMIPNRYTLKVAKAGNNVRIADGVPVYHEFFEVNAGDTFEQAKEVERAILEAFPAPKFQVTCYQSYNGAMPVDSFDWRA